MLPRPSLTTMRRPLHHPQPQGGAFPELIVILIQLCQTWDPIALFKNSLLASALTRKPFKTELTVQNRILKIEQQNGSKGNCEWNESKGNCDIYTVDTIFHLSLFAISVYLLIFLVKNVHAVSNPSQNNIQQLLRCILHILYVWHAVICGKRTENSVSKM